MKKIILICLAILISITAQSQSDTVKRPLLIGGEIYSGINSLSEAFQFKSIWKTHQDTTYLKNGFGIIVFCPVFPKLKKIPLTIKTGFTVFNLFSDQVISIPLELNTGISLSRNLILSASLGGRYLFHANKDFNNKVYPELGIGLTIPIKKHLQIGIKYRQFHKEKFFYGDFPVFQIKK